MHMILPQIEPTEITPPSVCPYEDCGGAAFRLHQKVRKPVKDTVYHDVTAHRYQCLRCGRTFREYPHGVSNAQASQRVKGLAVLLYLLGLSYADVSLALEAFGVYMCKSGVYDAVQEAAKRVRGLNREAVFEKIRTLGPGCDVTSVKCRGRWLPLGLTVDNLHERVLTARNLEWEDAEMLRACIEPLAAVIGAEIRITNDRAADSAADQLRVSDQALQSVGSGASRS